MPDHFQNLGVLIAQSLRGHAWKSALVSLGVVDVGVLDAKASYTPQAGGMPRDFDFSDPVGVAEALFALRADMIAQGHPPWKVLTLHLRPTGEFAVDYGY